MIHTRLFAIGAPGPDGRREVMALTLSLPRGFESIVAIGGSPRPEFDRERGEWVIVTRHDARWTAEAILAALGQPHAEVALIAPEGPA